MPLAAKPRDGTRADASLTEATTACCFCSSSTMAMDIMDTPEPIATPVPTSPVRARMDMETYTDCVLGIMYSSVCS